LHELIGRPVRVASSDSSAFLGISGTIADETRNTFLVETAEGKRVRVPKSACVFEITFGKKKVNVPGKDILYRPEDRTKVLKA